jgi:hypothetical protein
MSPHEKTTILRACISMRQTGLTRQEASRLLSMSANAEWTPTDVDDTVDECYTFLDKLLKPEVVL